MMSIDCLKCNHLILHSKIHRHWSSIHHIREESFSSMWLMIKKFESQNDTDIDSLESMNIIKLDSIEINTDG